MVLNVLGGIRHYVPVTGRRTKPVTEGLASILSYRVTALIFLLCCVLVTSVEFVGNGITISCIQDGHPDYWAIPYHVMNTYCYIMGTFTLPPHHGEDEEVLHPGVGVYHRGDTEEEYKAYYQWVPFVLFFQACAFYFPHSLFKMAEGGKIAGIISGLHQAENVLQDQTRANRYNTLSKYMAKTLNTHNHWAFKMFLCEIFGFVNILANIYFIDVFLGNEFSQYGVQVALFLNDDQTKRTDPMSRVFPKMTKCTYNKYGLSGTIQTFDALCMLPVNVMNEKIYVFLWFWLIFLAIISILSLLYHLVLILHPTILSAMIKIRVRHNRGLQYIIDDITKSFKFGDWRLLHILAYNMTPIVFGEFLLELDDQFAIKEVQHNSFANDKQTNRKTPTITSI